MLRNLLVIFIVGGFILSTPILGMGSAPKKPAYKLEILKMEIVPSPEAKALATPESKTKVIR